MPRRLPNDWHDGFIPDNVVIHELAYVETSQSFELFRSLREEAMVVGPAASVYPPTMFDVGPGGRIVLGEYAMLNGPRIICDELVQIGPYCMIAWNVVLMDTYRVPLDPAGRHAELARVGGLDMKRRRLDAGGAAKPIRIGANVWIGFDAIVLPGASIGEGSVVGARSVVAGDVPAYSIVAGNPARVVKKLTRTDAKPPSCAGG